MKKFIIRSFVITIMAIIVFPASLLAANHYIRQGSAGSNNGSDWSNAWTEIPENLVRGNTYYVADGIYRGHIFNDAAEGTKVITVKKATAIDHGTDIGWQSSYGDGQAVFQYPKVTAADEKTVISFRTSYITFDGSVGSGGNISSYGFRVKYPGDMGEADNASTLRSDITGIGLPPTGYSSLAVSNIKVSHVAVEGPGAISCTEGTPYTCSNAGISGNSSNASNIEIAYNYLFGWQTQISLFNTKYMVVHDNYLDSNTSSSTGGHGQQMNVDGTRNVLIYNNIFKNSKTFIMGAHGNIGSNTGLAMYNNISYGQQGDGLTACFANAGSAANNVIVGSNFHNNTFVNINCGGRGAVFIGNLTDVSSQKSYAYNNLFYNVTHPRMDNPGFTAGAIVHDNNAYLSCTGIYSSAAESAPLIGSADPFVDLEAGNFRLAVGASPNARGKNLSMYFTTDKDGRPRGSSLWSIGAYRAGGPVPPENITITIKQ